MSAFKPFVPDVIPQHQQHHHHQQQQQPSCNQASVGNGVFQPIIVHPSYCGSANTLPRGGHSPDIGYVSLEHPSRSASFVSQISTQFSPSSGKLPRDRCGSFDPASCRDNKRCGSFDPSACRDIQAYGRAQLHDSSVHSHSDSSNSAVTSYRGSLSSVCGPNNGNSWMSKKQGSIFELANIPRRPIEDERQTMYSTVAFRSEDAGETGRHHPGSGIGGTPMTSVAQRDGHGRGTPTISSASKDACSSMSDLRNILMIKETELRMMRETMAKNESAIIQVFEDKKRKWQVEMLEKKRDWENQMQAQENKAWKTEQLLQFQVTKLHQENKRLQTRTEELEADKKRLSEECRRLETEMESLKDDMRGLLADVSMKDIDLMNQVGLQSCTIDTNRYKIDSDTSKIILQSPPNSNTPMCSSRDAVGPETANGHQKRAKHPPMTAQCLNRSCSEQPIGGATKADIRALSIPELQKELEKSRLEAEACRMELEQERQNWLAEKEKVIDYQKRLQLNYLQVLHKNRLLELDVQQLTGEMAALDIKQLAREENQSTRTADGEPIY